MKLLYLDCGMGAAGDMLTAALLELFDDPAAMVEKLNNLGLPGITYVLERSEKCGIRGSHVRVLTDAGEEDEHSHDPHEHDHHTHAQHDHVHTALDEILHRVYHLNMPQRVKDNVAAVYSAIAQAESQVHGTPIEQIHFHEVGSLDAVADVTAVCYLLDALNVDEIHASPVHVGSGQVTCAHGILPVPAPATALLLTGIPTYGGEIRGELCTPTGAALLKTFVHKFGAQETMTVQKIGYGCGKKDFPRANCVRALLGTQEDSGERVAELRCNLDDMTGEELGFAQQQLLENGALDVWATPIYMKKNRPGCLLSVLCKEDEREKFVELLLQYTSTLGVRWEILERTIRPRQTETLNTPYGTVRKKCSGGIEKYEYEDLSAIAQKAGKSLSWANKEVSRWEAERH